jgi:hypothetical protein
MEPFNYVTQENTKTGKTTLLGYNLTEEQAEDLMYSLGKDKDCSNGDERGGDAHLSNSCGNHQRRYKTAAKAHEELITKPARFNDALDIINKAGYDVVQKGVVGKNMRVQSYQSEHDEIF